MLSITRAQDTSFFFHIIFYEQSKNKPSLEKLYLICYGKTITRKNYFSHDTILVYTRGYNVRARTFLTDIFILTYMIANEGTSK